VAFIDYPIIHERTLEQVKSSNRARNAIASKDMISLQEGFIAQVEAELEKAK